MAIVAASEAISSLGAEEEGAEELEGDNAQSAMDKGVEIEKIIGQAISVGSSIFGLITAIAKGKEDTADILERRLAAGILRPTEDRDALIKANAIAPYWASSNIHRMIDKGTLPFGWSVVTTVGQGFADDIAAFQLRARRGFVAKRRDEDLRRHLLVRRIEMATDLRSETAKTKAAAALIKTSVVQ